MLIDGLTVTVTRKPIKNMYLRIKPPNGEVVISAPRRTSDATIIEFVRGRRAWIDRNRQRMRQAREHSDTPAPSENADEQTPNTTFVWTDAARNRAAANINAQLPELLRKWQPIIGRAPTRITLRVMTTRWGSCTPKTGRIRLNLQLGLMSPQLLEYVLVHEMTHLWERGHGPGFQRRMSTYLPNWKQLRRELNRCVVL
ncbi:M48 family metallopeptidase [Bifidobacterium oedipodis]|uniref:Metal-dependent hydrolase n=1 Tax=Bifidobacterium oedipodis TaxID=2675322 RepID=A0A7Y0ESX9_9BIFI|nr:SprT family zinc-dependent metalloprotease [Bifidobacterium sp. DSM 109957]NMM94766.1 metal-dependent hydrolase [Bifidobacterium sp. DSM 109957]